jgi:hypothetical protein
MDILEICRKFQAVSGWTVSLGKIANNDLEREQEVARLTGIQVVTGFRHNGVQVSKYHMRLYARGSGQNAAKSLHLGRIYSKNSSAVIPFFSHIFCMSFGPVRRRGKSK